MSKKPRTDDLAKFAESIADQASVQAHLEATTKNPAAVELGRLGGLKGGKARAESLSKKRRGEIAKRAAAARWNKTRKELQ